MIQGNLMTIFIKYFLAGCIAVAAHFLVMILMVEIFKSPPLFASFAGFCIGSLVNYSLQYNWTFSSDSSHQQAGLRYLFVTTSMLCLNMMLFEALFSLAEMDYRIAQSGATALVFLANFVINANFTFRQTASESRTV